MKKGLNPLRYGGKYKLWVQFYPFRTTKNFQNTYYIIYNI